LGDHKAKLTDFEFRFGMAMVGETQTQNLTNITKYSQLTLDLEGFSECTRMTWLIIHLCLNIALKAVVLEGEP